MLQGAKDKKEAKSAGKAPKPSAGKPKKEGSGGKAKKKVITISVYLLHYRYKKTGCSNCSILQL